MTNRVLGPLLTFTIALAPLGCGGETTLPVAPGRVTGSVVTGSSSDGAMLFTIRGPGMTNVASTNSSNQLFSRLVAPQELRVIVIGNISTGPLFTMDVPNLNDISGFSATVDQVADRDDDLRADISGYSISFPAPAPSTSGVLAPTR
jgi:hypothetical protein